MGRRKKRSKTAWPKKLFLGLVAFFLLVLLVAAARAYFQFKKAALPPLSRLSFIFIDHKNEPLLFSFEEKEGTIVTLPATDKVWVPYGFGEYQLGKVYALGELENKGGLLLAKTVEEMLEVPIFGYFKSRQSAINTFLPQPKKLFEDIFWQSWWGRLETNLSRRDLLSLYLRLRNLDEALIKVKTFNSQSLSDFQDRQLREEAFSIEVLNATEQLGLAQKTARFLEKAGARVIRIADAQEKQEECWIVSNQDPQSYTLVWLGRVFQCPLKRFEKEISRAEISLILGENYWNQRAEKW
ncbi:MAG TPA: LytR C-terminal domain-containing protein [Clostridia bacterium]|nr:LytR C-terminal domain-containing protein [Clostridia bacterium]